MNDMSRFPIPKTVLLTFQGIFYIGMLSASMALAQLKPDLALPEVLKGIKQATGTCTRDDVTPGSAQPIARALPDLSCAIAPMDLAGLRGRPETVLVDIRTSSEYSGFHVDGSLNIDASSVRTKSFLKGKTIVLIGNGKAERELYVACAELKGRGFKQTRVLRGGMPLWALYDQPLVGRAPDLMQSTMLDPIAFSIESEFTSNLVLITRPQASMQKLLKFSVIIPDATPASVKTVIERRRKELKNAPLASIILVVEPGSDIGSFQALRQSIQPVPLLIYADTQEAFVRQQKQQKAIWVAQARGPKRPRCGM